jgi:hypothetical protein
MKNNIVKINRKVEKDTQFTKTPGRPAGPGSRVLEHRKVGRKIEKEN